MKVTAEYIKKALRIKAKKYHPDKGGDEETMKEIIAAYEFLTGKTEVKLPPPQRVQRVMHVYVGTPCYYTTTSNTSAATTGTGW